MEHECKQIEFLRQMEVRLAVAESDIKQVKDDIRNIKINIDKFNWLLIGTMASTIGSMILILMKQ